jgi:O-antigen/teichoic acid export membrane protein
LVGFLTGSKIKMKKNGVIQKNKRALRRKKVSTKFTSVLAIISIVGFTEILLGSFFKLSISEYSSFLWLLIMGIGLILITNPKVFIKRAKNNFNEASFSMLTTFVLGVMAIIGAILSFPLINLDHPILSATLGIISTISIIFIIFQSWVIKE